MGKGEPPDLSRMRNTGPKFTLIARDLKRHTAFPMEKECAETNNKAASVSMSTWWSLFKIPKAKHIAPLKRHSAGGGGAVNPKEIQTLSPLEWDIRPHWDLLVFLFQSEGHHVNI